MVRAVLAFLCLNFQACAVLTYMNPEKEHEIVKGLQSQYFVDDDGVIHFKSVGRSNPIWKDKRFKKNSALGQAYVLLNEEQNLWVTWGYEMAQANKLKLDKLIWKKECENTIKIAAVQEGMLDPQSTVYFIEIWARPMLAVQNMILNKKDPNWKLWSGQMEKFFRERATPRGT